MGVKVKSTLLGNLSELPQIKIEHALTKEEKEVMKLQHILELEKQNAEKRAKNLQNALQNESRKIALKDDFI